MNEILKKYERAGRIAKDVVNFSKSFIKGGMKLVDVAEKIEERIRRKAEIAFPVNLCINEVAAHYTPSLKEERIVEGLLKVDIGVHVDGYIVDTAFSMDFENKNINKKLIKASEIALENAISSIKNGIKLREIGKEIEKSINKFGFKSIINLAGHSLSQYELHSGLTIPNHDNNDDRELKEGFYAIEPFSTNGEGIIIEAFPSSIYKLIQHKPSRSLTRKVFNYIVENYKTLPFCSRWLEKEFGKNIFSILKLLEKEKILYNYYCLIEKKKGIVSQSEHTIYFDGEKIKVLTY